MVIISHPIRFVKQKRNLKPKMRHIFTVLQDLFSNNGILIKSSQTVSHNLTFAYYNTIKSGKAQRDENIQTLNFKEHKNSTKNVDRIHTESAFFAVLWYGLDDNQRLGIRHSCTWNIF